MAAIRFRYVLPAAQIALFILLSYLTFTQTTDISTWHRPHEGGPTPETVAFDDGYDFGHRAESRADAVLTALNFPALIPASLVMAFSENVADETILTIWWFIFSVVQWLAIGFAIDRRPMRTDGGAPAGLVAGAAVNVMLFVSLIGAPLGLFGTAMSYCFESGLMSAGACVWSCLGISLAFRWKRIQRSKEWESLKIA